MRCTIRVLAAGLALAAAQAACAATIKDAMDQRVGQPLTGYALDHGAPQSSFDLGNRERAFVWTYITGTPTYIGQCTVTLVATSKSGNASRLADWMVTGWRVHGYCP